MDINRTVRKILLQLQIITTVITKIRFYHLIIGERLEYLPLSNPRIS